MDSASMNLIAEHVKRAPDPQAWYAAFAVASKDALKRACEEASAKAGGKPTALSAHDVSGESRDTGGKFASVNGGTSSEQANKRTAEAVAATAIAKDRLSHQQAQYAHEDAASSHREAMERHNTWAARIVQSNDPQVRARHAEYSAWAQEHAAIVKHHEAQADAHEKARLGARQGVALSSARAPHGYTRQKPLVIQGHSYVGGEFIPGDVMAKATASEKAKIRGGAPSQSAMAQQHEKAHANDRPAPKPAQPAESKEAAADGSDYMNAGWLSPKQRSSAHAADDTPFAVTDSDGKVIGYTTDENHAATEAKKAGGKYKFDEAADEAPTPQATEQPAAPAGGSAAGFQGEPHTPPPPGTAYVPNVQTINPATGTTAAARVGVPGSVVPPPPPIGVLPNLTDRERTIERSFASAYEAEPDMVADDYRLVVHENTTPGDPPTFETDGAKVLMNEWMDKDQATRAQNRATLNTPLHQTANAVCKRAFLKHLDTLHKGDQILVTVGGCGAGKGFALKKIPQALALKKESRVVWDSAGDQCATENPWIQSEAEKRGLKVAYVFVHADPRKQWADPERGVVKRAADPSDGRMVGAAVFADSYALGAKNMQAHYEKHKDNPNASFMFLQNAGPTPQQLPGIPPEALNIDRHELRKFAVDTVNGSNAPDHVKRGALMDQRIWPESSNKPASNQPAAASNQ